MAGDKKTTQVDIETKQGAKSLKDLDAAARASGQAVEELGAAIERTEKKTLSNARAAALYRSALRQAGESVGNLKALEAASASALNDSKESITTKTSALEAMIRKTIGGSATIDRASRLESEGYARTAEAMRLVVSQRGAMVDAAATQSQAARVLAAYEASSAKRAATAARELAAAKRQAEAVSVIRPEDPALIKSAAESAGVFATALRDEWAAADGAAEAQARLRQRMEEKRIVAAKMQAMIDADAAAQADQIQQTKAAAAEQAKQASRIRELTGTYAALHSEQTRLTADLAEITALHKSGAVSAGVFAEAQNRIRNRLSSVNSLLDRSGRNSRFSAYQMQNLSFQVNDLVTQMASGTPPMQAFAQQGGQILQVFQMAGFSIGGTIAMVAGLAAVVGGGIAANMAYASSQREIHNALVTSGFQAGITSDEINRFSRSLSDAVDVSISEARDLAVALVSVGPASQEVLDVAGANIRAFAAAFTDGDIDEATEKLVEVFKKPADFAKEHTDIFTTAQRGSIAMMQAQGDASGAFLAVMDRLGPRLDGVTSRAGVLEQVGNALSNTWHNLGVGFTRTDSAALAVGDKVSRLRQQLRSLGNNSSALAEKLRAQIEAFEAQEEAAKRSALAAAELARSQRAVAAGTDLFRSIEKGAAVFQKLSVDLAVAQSALAGGGVVLNRSSDEYKNLSATVEALSFATRTFKTDEEKAVLVANAQAKATRLGTAAAREVLAVELARISLMGRALTARQRQAVLDAAEVTARAATQREAFDQTINIVNDEVQQKLRIAQAGYARERSLLERNVSERKASVLDGLEGRLAILKDEQKAELAAARSKLDILVKYHADRHDEIAAAENEIALMEVQHANARMDAEGAIVVEKTREALAERRALIERDLSRGLAGVDLSAQRLDFQTQVQGTNVFTDLAAREDAYRQLEERRYQIVRAGIAQRRALAVNDHAARLALKAEAEDLERTHQATLLRIAQDSARSRLEIARSITAPIASGFQSMASGIINQTSSMRDLAVSAAGQIASAWVGSIIQIGVEWFNQHVLMAGWDKLFGAERVAAKTAEVAATTGIAATAAGAEVAIKAGAEATKTGATVAGVSARTAAEVAGAATATAAEGGQTIASILMSAGRAFAAAYASIAAIPVIGPVLAPAAAAAAFYGAYAIGKSVVSAEGGLDRVKYDGQPAVLHKDEAVLPAWMANPFREMLAGRYQPPGFLARSPGVSPSTVRSLTTNSVDNSRREESHFHLHALDMKGADEWLMSKKDVLAKAMRSSGRNYAT